MAKKKSADLFDEATAPKAKKSATKPKKTAEKGYSAADIEVLEGLEPVRRRPGMYIGGTDSRAMHCLLYTSPSPRDYAASRMPSSA